MPPAHHVREWPDKILFAAILLLAGALLGLVFDALRLAGATIGAESINFALQWPAGVTIALEAVAALAAGYSAYHQSARYLVLGAVLGILSMGFFFLVPLFALASLGMVLKAVLEGEEIKHDERRMHASLWPDKAFAASLVLVVAGLTTLLHGFMVMADKSWTWIPGGDAAAGTITALGAVFILWAARQLFHLRRSWAGWLAGMVAVGLVAFTVIGPLGGIAALVLLALADRENEFVTPAAA